MFKNRISINTLLLCFFFTFFLTACSEKARYERLVEKELNKGIRKDSLFLGLSLGMPMKQFYVTCWNLNKEGVVRNGVNNTSVEYVLKGLKHPAKMNFYPKFHDQKIYQMPVIITYDDWAPWNKSLWSDSLQLDVLNLYKKWHGDDFMEIKNPTKEDHVAYLKVDGNKQISIFRSSDSEVSVLYTDLIVDKELKGKNKDSLSMK